MLPVNFASNSAPGAQNKVGEIKKTTLGVQNIWAINIGNEVNAKLTKCSIRKNEVGREGRYNGHRQIDAPDSNLRL